jgi:RimK family alpha-L-glutamate ligase
MRIGLAIDVPDWHSSALLRACNECGIAAGAFRLSEAAFDSGGCRGLSLPGFGTALPDAVLVRSIAGGSFEEVTRRLGILHALRELGVPVWNDARAIERCVDKSTTSFLLGQAGVATPACWAVEGHAAALAVVERERRGGPLVLKPLFGSQGRGLRLVHGAADLPPAGDVGGVYYLQRFLAPGETSGGDGKYRDHRLFVCAGEAIAAMTRQAEGWVTNVHLGALPLPFAPDADLVELAVRAAACVGAAYAGVDIMRDRDGRPFVLEVNSMPGWRGLQRVASGSIAVRVVAALRAALR